MIVAISENEIIGNKNKLPWHLPADLKYFKEKTKGHAIIMGRKTFESLGKALAHRVNIVVSRQENFKADNVHVYNNIHDALAYAKEIEKEECFIIGGAEIFLQAQLFADRFYVTRIHENFEGDTSLNFDFHDWHILSDRRFEPDGKNKYAYSFLVYERK